MTLERRTGPLAFAQGKGEVSLDTLAIARTDHGVTLEGEGVRIDLVEHLLAAIAALGIARDLRVNVDGPELPLLDGGAAIFFDALRSLEIPPTPRGLVVEKAATLRFGASTYRFEPSAGTHLEVEIAFDHPVVGMQKASWDGDPADFRETIAPCRTFGFLRDAEALRKSGRARGVDPRRVVVLTDDGILDASAPLLPNEAAGHKLLDLIGDLALYGGPPRGRITTCRPGHEATHAVVREALALGVLARAGT